MSKNGAANDLAMARVRGHWEILKSSWRNQQGLREGMGYSRESARKRISQILRSHDPQISVLRRSAKAVDVSIAKLVKE
jgi:hypothetical protein